MAHGSHSSFPPELLDRFVDRELSDADDARVREHLGGCDACARHVRGRRALTASLKEGLVHYPAPDVLTARIRGALADAAQKTGERGSARPTALNRRWPVVAAAAMLVVVTSLATYSITRFTLERPSDVQGVFSSHVRSLEAGHLIDVASNDQHNVKPWFNGRVALSPPVPSLDARGFTLVGGRMDYVGGQPAAVVVYSRRRHWINVFALAHAGPDAGVAARNLRGFHFFTWRAEGIELWAASDLNDRELREFVDAYRAQAP